MQLNFDSEKSGGGIIEVLFDKDNTSDIVLVNEKGQELAFKQIYATVKDNVVYCILAPVEDVENLPADVAFVFMLARGHVFTVVRDEALCECIFLEYYNFLNGEGECHGK